VCSGRRPDAPRCPITDVQDVMPRRKRAEMTDRPMGGEGEMTMMGT
jgi:hypothetical protein